jgi:phosphate:Na+ symporter
MVRASMAEAARREFLSHRHTRSEEICGMAERIARVFRLAMEGFGRFRAESLRQALEGGQAVEREAERLTASLVALAGGRPDGERAGVQSDIGAVSQLKLISGCIEDFCESAMAKIKEGVLFSDDAFKEIEDLHAEVESLLHNAVQAMRGGEGNLSSTVAEKGRAVEMMINNFSIEHEKRLISGACEIRSSAIFLDILDALRRIAGHAVALARAAGGADIMA